VATRVLLVEDNAVYRSSLELLLGLQTGSRWSAPSAAGDEAAKAARELAPTSS
jgi:DNA-binding NarL/FixJ family response regulator